MKRIVSFSAGFVLSLLAYNASAQTFQWWDNNGASAATSGTWDTATANWANSATLTASTVAFTNGNFPIFAAGSAGIVNLTITVPGAVTCEGFGDATTSTGAASGAAITNLTFSGAGSINLPAGTWAFECGNSSPAPNIFIDVPITGPGGFIQHNAGTLALYGTNTYSGGTEITGGQLLLFNNNASFGTGPFTNTGTQSIENTSASLVTLPNAFCMNNAGGVMNFAGGNVTCTGPWYLETTPLVKDNSATLPLTISGVISSIGGAYGLGLQNADATAVGSGIITLSGANTYIGPTSIGAAVIGGVTTVSVSSINSVATPPQQSSSSLGVPSSVANGTIAIGATIYGCGLIYTGPGETSDRVINLVGTTGGATIEMDGTGPLVLTSSFTVTTAGARTLTLQGSSTTTNTIAGAIPNSSSGATTLTKAQAGTWVLTGTNTFSGNTTVSAGTLTIGGAGKLNSGTYAGTITDNGTFVYGSSSAQTLSGVISGSGTLTLAGSGTLTLSGANTYSGITTNSAGILQVDHADIAGTSGPLGKATAAGSIVMNGGTLQYVAANASHDYSVRFSTAAGQAYNIDVNGQSVPFATALSSSTGELTLKSTTAGGTLTLNAPASYGGATTITSGTLAIGSAGSLGGGNYSPNITDNGAFVYGGSAAQTLSGVISGSGALTQNGPGGLSLTAADTYAGATTIGAASTLYLTGSGSINSSTSMSIAAGGTFDVSALASPYNFSTTSLAASGSSSAAATINGASGGVINLGSQPISLTISPTVFTGESTQPALVIPQSLTVNGNVITVNNASGTALGTGNYILIQVGSGITTGTPSQYVTVTGSGLANGDFATVQVNNGNVILSVQQPPNSNPTWNGNDYANLQTWSDGGNWVSGVPDASGDQVFFANTSSESPVMDSSYSVYSLTFNSGAASDTLVSSGGSVLTVGSGVTNNSGNPQTLAMPVQLVDLGGPLVPSQWNLSSGNITASGVISDNNTGLAVSGANTLTLSALNTYTGGTTINGATLSVNTIADANCSIGPSGSVGLNSATLAYTGSATTPSTVRQFNGTSGTTSTIDVPNGVTLTLTGRVTGSAAWTVNKTDSGTLILGGTGDNSFLGMNVNGGLVILDKTSGSGHAIGNPLSVANGAEVQLSGAGYGSEIYNNATTPVTINNGGLFDLNGQNNTINLLNLSGTGNTYNNSGGVLINSATGTTSTLTCAVALVANSTIGGSGNIALPGVMSGSGIALTYAGTGILTLGGVNTYSGGTTVNAGGTLQLTAGGVTSSSAGTEGVNLNGNAVLNLYMTNTEMNNPIFGGSANLINIRMGAGNLWLSNSAASQLNSFTGTFNVTSTSATGGQLVIGTSAFIETISSSATWQLQSGAVIDFNGGQTDPATVYLYGAPYSGASDGALRLDDSVQSGPVILMGNSQIGNGSSTGPSTVSGIISDGGHGYGFTKVGANPVVLSAANTYTGSTIVSAGTLDISTGSIAGNATVSAGVLEMDNSAAMVSTSTLSVATGASVNLNYSGTQTINALFVAGVQQPPGVYGASAPYNPGSVFTGSGTVTVGSGPPVTISASVNGSGQLVISWNSVNGGNYNVYTTPSLNPPVTWTLVTSVPATGSSTSYNLGTVSGNLFVTVMQ